MSLTVIIITKNEEEMVAGAVKSAVFADQILVFDTGSKDRTVSIAEKLKVDVFQSEESKIDFSLWRNQSLKKAKGDWVFYLDADEKITSSLQEEIKKINASKAEKFTAYAVPRANFYLGKRVRYGGSYPDYVERLFYKPALVKWQGGLHERPVYNGSLGYLKNHLEHFTHRDLTSMMEKTIRWTAVEAKLLYDSHHPKVVWWRILRMMLTKFWQRVIKEQSWKDGTVGWINATFEVFNTFIIYARLWELQQKK